jgi:hypothetical protein
VSPPSITLTLASVSSHGWPAVRHRRNVRFRRAPARCGDDANDVERRPTARESDNPFLARFQASHILTPSKRDHSRDGGAMFDLLFETFRKASESSMQMPLDMIKNLTQQMPSASGASLEWSKAFQKRWSEFAIENLQKNRESLDATYRSGIQLIEQTFRLSEAKSTDEQRRIVEDLWGKLLDMFKQQSESQVSDFQSWAAKSFEMQRASA